MNNIAILGPGKDVQRALLLDEDLEAKVKMLRVKESCFVADDVHFIKRVPMMMELLDLEWKINFDFRHS